MDLQNLSLEQYLQLIEGEIVDKPRVELPMYIAEPRQCEEHLFFVTDSSFQSIEGTSQLEQRLTIGSNPHLPQRTLSLRGTWTSMTFPLGAPIYVEADLDSPTPVVDDTIGLIVLYPQDLIKVRSLSQMGKCHRLAYLLETLQQQNLNVSNLYARMARTLAVTHLVKGPQVSVPLLAQEVKDKFAASILMNSSISEELNGQYEELVETLDRGMAIDIDTTNVPDALFVSTVQHPSRGVSSIIPKQNMWSFELGIAGQPAAVVESNTGETFPVEIATIGSSSKKNASVSSAQMSSISAYVQLMKDRFSNGFDSGFVWHLGSNARFWVTPHRSEFVSLAQQRNFLVLSLSKGKIPNGAFDLDKCKYCSFIRQCNFLRGSYMRESDISNYSSKDFLEDMDPHQCRFRQLLPFGVVNLNERVRQGKAVTCIKLVQITTLSETNSNGTVRYSLQFEPLYPGAIDRACAEYADEAIVTESGDLPVLAIGSVISITSQSVVVKSFNTSLTEGSEYTIDFFRGNKWDPIDRDSLYELLDSEDRTNLRDVLLHKSPTPRTFRLIDASPGTGDVHKTVELILSNPDKRILVSCLHYSTLSRICKRLLTLNRTFIICGKDSQIPDELREFYGGLMLQKTRSVLELYNRLTNCKVYITSALHMKFDVILDTDFDLSIVLEASLIKVARSLPLLRRSSERILFGDLTLGYDSIFGYLASLYPSHVTHQTVVYETAHALVKHSEIFWKRRIPNRSLNANYSTAVLKLISSPLRELAMAFSDPKIPLCFVDTDSEKALFQIAIIQALLFKDVILLASNSVLPFLTQTKTGIINEPKLAFTKGAEKLCEATKRISIRNIRSVEAERFDVVICFVDTNFSNLLRAAFSCARWRIVLVGKTKIVKRSYIFSKLLERMESNAIIQFPREVIEKPNPPFNVFPDT